MRRLALAVPSLPHPAHCQGPSHKVFHCCQHLLLSACFVSSAKENDFAPPVKCWVNRCTGILYLRSNAEQLSPCLFAQLLMAHKVPPSPPPSGHTANKRALPPCPAHRAIQPLRSRPWFDLFVRADPRAPLNYPTGAPSDNHEVGGGVTQGSKVSPH